MKQTIVKEEKIGDFNGKPAHIVTFEDGTTGFYDVKIVGDLKQGDHVEYTVEQKQNKTIGKFNVLTIYKIEPKPDKTKYGSIDPMFILEERCKAVVESMKLTMQAVIEDKLTFDKVKEQFKEVNNCVQEAIDEIISE